MGTWIELLISREPGAGEVRSFRCDRSSDLEVRELTTRAVIRIRAADVSPYRHTLLVDGRAYRILNVFGARTGAPA